MNINEILLMPTLFIHPTMRCNLACPYCTQVEYRKTHSESDDFMFLENPLLLKTLRQVEPTHLLLSGGEPLLTPGLKEFIKEFGALGHMFSFNTNLQLSLSEIESFFSAFPSEYFATLNISHHYLVGITYESVLEHCQLLRKLGIDKFWINYLLLPGKFEEVADYGKRLRAEGISARNYMLFGNWKDRKERFPIAYTVEESIECLKMAVTRMDVATLFDGIYTKGRPCRGGQDHISWGDGRNRNTYDVVSPCPSGASRKLSLNDTFFVTGNRERKPCELDYCLCASILTTMTGGHEDDFQETAALVSGTAAEMGMDRALEFLEDLLEDGYKLVNEKKYFDILTAVKGEAHARLC